MAKAPAEAQEKVVMAAMELEEFCDRRSLKHLPGCLALYSRGPCDCGLPQVMESLTNFRAARPERNLPDADAE